MESMYTLLNFCPVPMVIVSEDNRFLFVNQSFTHIFGYDLNDIPDIDRWFALAYPEDEQYRNERKLAWKTSVHTR